MPVCEPASGPEISGGWFTARTQVALAACACGGAASLIFAVDPGSHAIYPPCLFHQLTGLYCAGCGTTRALHALLHGNLVAALHDNALFVGALPFLAWAMLPYLGRVWGENRWPVIRLEGRKEARYALGIAALALGFTLIRNLPGWPFELLKPL
jgi:hypothetical protein